jgi:DNA modification methylase
LTDPPYGMNLDTDFKKMCTTKSASKRKDLKKIAESKKYRKVKGDNEDFTPELINTIFSNFNYCKEIFLFGADYYSDLIPNKNKGSWIIWDKRAGIETMKWSTSEFETCWSKTKHHRKIARFMWTGMCGTQNEKEETKINKGAIKRMHPNQKPTILFDWFFENWGKDKTNIVDLYGGSGSVLISCERNNKKCFIQEYDVLYCQVIIDRYINFKQNNGEDVFLLKNGKKIPYSEISQEKDKNS